MPLYNRLLEREDIKDEDKKHYQFWEDVEKSPVGKANKWLNQGASSDTSPEQKQLYRSGEKGKVLQGLQYVNDALDVTQTVVGLPVQALGWTFNTAMEGLSDATGYDKRSLNTALTIAGLSKAKVIPKGSRLHKSIQTAGQQAGARAGTQARHLKTNLKQAKTFYDERFSPDPSKRVVDVTSQKLDSIFNMPPAEFQKIIRLANQPGINSLTLARRFNQQQGVIKTYLDSKGKTDLTEGAKDLKASSLVKDWTKYGYGPDETPTQVKKAETPEDETIIANSLDGFYNRTQQYVNSKLGTKGSIKDVKKVLTTNPAYWTNPVTNKIYRASWKGGFSRRLTIKPVNRDFLQYQQSSVIQKAGNLLNQKQITKMNDNLKTQHEQKYKELATRNEQLNAEISFLKENPGAAYASDRQLNVKLAEQQRVNTQIENLVKGNYYTEHGYYLQSAKVRNHILDNSGDTIHNSKQFQLGDLKNQTTVFENQNLAQHESFRKIKNRFEIAIDSLNDGYYQYPGIVVNYNPALSGSEFIIRIEKSAITYAADGTPILKDFRVGRDIPGVLSGPQVLRINYASQTQLLDNLKTTEDVKNWLATQGIHPVPKEQSFKQQSFKIRQNRKPTTSLAEKRKFFKDLAEKAYDLRMSIEDYLKSLGTTAGDTSIKRGPRGPYKPRKKDNPNQQDLDL